MPGTGTGYRLLLCPHQVADGITLLLIATYALTQTTQEHCCGVVELPLLHILGTDTYQVRYHTRRSQLQHITHTHTIYQYRLPE